MGDWKNTEWQKKLKNKPLKYWIRDEIEEVIKEENIDRKRFSEYSKFKYEDVIKHFYYTFMDYEKSEGQEDEMGIETGKTDLGV